MATDPRADASSLLSFDGQWATLLVGPKKQPFTCQLSLLRRTSKFFIAAFMKGAWKEGIEAKMNLSEDEPNIVQLYLHFVATHQVATRSGDKLEDGSEVVNTSEYGTLAKLYCFGEKYQDVQCKNAVITAMIAKSSLLHDGFHWFPTGDIVDLIYKGTCPGSKARKLMVDMHVRSGVEEWFNEGVINPEFIVDLAKAFFKIRQHCDCSAFEVDGEEEGRHARTVDSEHLGGYKLSLYHE